jgi:hypothetical protein
MRAATGDRDQAATAEEQQVSVGYAVAGVLEWNVFGLVRLVGHGVNVELVECAKPQAAVVCVGAIKKARGRTIVRHRALLDTSLFASLRWIPFSVGESLTQVVAHFQQKSFREN